MTPQERVVNREIVADNEAAAQAAYQRGDYVSCFLLAHSLVEALLRAFLSKTKRENFSGLIKAYEEFLAQEGQSSATFVKELTEFNRRRNRIIHQLWEKGYTVTNEKLAPACQTAFQVYGLFIEWLETFNPEITDFGFEYE
jgi:HEPN domain-containing protein